MCVLQSTWPQQPLSHSAVNCSPRGFCGTKSLMIFDFRSRCFYSSFHVDPQWVLTGVFQCLVVSWEVESVCTSFILPLACFFLVIIMRPQSEGSWDCCTDQFKMELQGGLFLILFSSPVSSVNKYLSLHLSFIHFPSPPLSSSVVLHSFLSLSHFPDFLMLLSFCILIIFSSSFFSFFHFSYLSFPLIFFICFSPLPPSVHLLLHTF